MNLLLFGATGATGRHILRQALQLGYSVTAFAREPHQLADVKHERLRVVKGDVQQPASIAAAMPGHDAVVVALGVKSLSYNTVLSSGTANIIWQMHQFGVRRLVVLSSLGVGDSRRELSVLARWFTIPLFYKKLLTQKGQQEANVRDSELDWVIVRPCNLTDDDATGQVFAGTTLKGQSGLSSSISRADLAAFLLTQLTRNTWLRRAVAVTGADSVREPLLSGTDSRAPSVSA